MQFQIIIRYCKQKYYFIYIPSDILYTYANFCACAYDTQERHTFMKRNVFTVMFCSKQLFVYTCKMKWRIAVCNYAPLSYRRQVCVK